MKTNSLVKTFSNKNISAGKQVECIDLTFDDEDNEKVGENASNKNQTTFNGNQKRTKTQKSKQTEALPSTASSVRVAVYPADHNCLNLVTKLSTSMFAMVVSVSYLKLEN